MSLIDRPRRRQAHLMLAEGERTPEAFARSCAGLGIDEDICQRTLSALGKVAAVDGFVPATCDDLLEVYGLADEDLDDDLVLPLLTQMACKIPTPAETSSMRPVRTVGDLVRFLQRMRAESR